MPLDVYDDMPNPLGSRSAARRGPRGRPYLCILFDCCGMYARVYRQPHEPVYHGRCPKCLRTLTVRVAPDGTPQRIFRAS